MTKTRRLPGVLIGFLAIAVVFLLILPSYPPDRPTLFPEQLEPGAGSLSDTEAVEDSNPANAAQQNLALVPPKDSSEWITVPPGVRLHRSQFVSGHEQAKIPAGFIRFNGVDVVRFLHTYRELAGAELEIDPEVHSVRSGIHFTNTEPVTRGEAIRIFDRLLFEQAGVIAARENNQIKIYRR